MRRSIALRTTIATHPRIIAAVAATVAGCLALLMTFVGGLVGASSASAASTTYTVEDLGTNFSPEDINSSGQVVGEGFTFTTGCGRERAILYSGGQRNYFASCDTASAALGINDSGKVVGVSGDHAFLYEQGQEGQIQDLGTLPGGTRSQALDINNTGEIVGWSATFTGDPEAFLHSNGQMQDLGTLGDAVGINDTGKVAGHANTTTGERHAFLYTKNTGQMQDLGTLPGFPGIRATDMNDSDEVAGYGLYRPADEEDYQDHAFLYEEGQTRDLGTLGGTNSWAWGINDTGQVVGDAETSTGESHAFLYSDGQMQDLNDLIPAESGWELHNARAINASGQIVGTGQINGGQGRAFLLTPNNTTPQPVDSASSEVAAGGTLSTATGDGTASSSDPVNTTITSPVGGAVSITETSATQQAPSGFTFFGEQVNIEAPEATVENPLILKFVLDASLLPEGQDPNTIELFRDATLAGECSDASGTASPDPCVSKREALASGDVAITVLSSHASAWNFAAPSYEFAGFYSPVDNLPTLNRAKAGSAIPVKFSLGGAMGLNVFAKDQSGSYPKSGSISCDPNANADTIEQTLNAGSSSLSYDASADRYTYVWKTDKRWENSCRQLVVKFKDGTEHRANFQLTK